MLRSGARVFDGRITRGISLTAVMSVLPVLTGRGMLSEEMTLNYTKAEVSHLNESRTIETGPDFNSSAIVKLFRASF